MVLIFCMQNLGLPLVLLLFQGDPFTRNLEVPVTTFSHLLICQVVLLLVHAGYRNLGVWRQIQDGFRLKVLRPLGFLERPGWTELLAMGVVGLAAMIITSIPGEVGAAPIWFKVVQGMIPLSFAPFLAVVPAIGLNDHKRGFSRFWPVTLYSLPVLCIGLAFNSRSFVFIGITLVGTTLVLLLICGKIRLRLKPALIVGAIGVLLISTIGSDIAVAVRVARVDRDNISALKVAENTLKLLTTDRKTLADLNDLMQQGEDSAESWYVTSPVFSRLVVTHFQDRAMACGVNLGNGQKEWLRQAEIERIWETLPNPLLRLLDVGIDKYQSTSGGGSMGALMLYLGGGSSDARTQVVFIGPSGNLEGDKYAVGGFIGDGYAAYGWAYLLPFGGISLLLFLFSDSLYGIVNRPTHENPYPQFHFAFVGLINSGALLGALLTESISGIIGFAIRQPLQMLVIYAGAFWMVRFVTRTFFGNRTAVLRPRTGG